MTDERPPRPPRPTDDEIEVVTEDSPITLRTMPMPPRLRPVSMQVPRPTGNSYLESQVGGVQLHLTSMAARQEEIIHVVDQRLGLFHQELALARHDVAAMTRQLEALRALVKGNHEERIAKVEKLTATAVVSKGGKAGGLIVLGGIVAELYPQWGGIIKAILGLQ